MSSIYNYGTTQNVPTVKLNNEYEMPMIGIGTYSLHDETCISLFIQLFNTDIGKLIQHICMVMKKKLERLLKKR